MKEIINLLTIWLSYRNSSKAILLLEKEIPLPHKGKQRNSNFKVRTSKNFLKLKNPMTLVSSLRSLKKSKEVHCSHNRFRECITAIWIKTADFRISQTPLQGFRGPNRSKSRVSHLRVIFARVSTPKKLTISSKCLLATSRTSKIFISRATIYTSESAPRFMRNSQSSNSSPSRVFTRHSSRDRCTEFHTSNTSKLSPSGTLHLLTRTQQLLSHGSKSQFSQFSQRRPPWKWSITRYSSQAAPFRSS